MQMGMIVSQEAWRADTTLQTGEAHCITAGTAVPLGTLTGLRQVLIQAKFSTTGIIYVGPSTVHNNYTDGIYLEKGDAIIFNTDKITDIYINSTINGEGVTFLAW